MVERKNWKCNHLDKVDVMGVKLAIMNSCKFPVLHLSPYNMGIPCKHQPSLQG